MSFAIVFPGQGSQSVGMLTEFYDNEKVVRSLFTEASECLDYDLWKLVLGGPKEQLDQTEITQPALLTSALAIWHVWRQAGGNIPQIVAGHSLGEYTALVAAAVLKFKDAVLLVRDRGRYMQDATPPGLGSMAAILGLGDDQVIEVCNREACGEIVSVANFNSPGQVVIAGHSAAVNRAAVAALEAGAKKVIPLDVSVPSHCGLMKEVAGKFSDRLNEVEFNDAVIPVVQNFDAEARTDAGEIRKALVMQLHQPVKWTDSIIKIQSRGITDIIECGPGRVLSGLIKRIDRGLNTYPLQDPKSLNTVLATQSEK